MLIDHIIIGTCLAGIRVDPVRGSLCLLHPGAVISLSVPSPRTLDMICGIKRGKHVAAVLAHVV